MSAQPSFVYTDLIALANYTRSFINSTANLYKVRFFVYTINENGNRVIENILEVDMDYSPIFTKAGKFSAFLRNLLSTYTNANYQIGVEGVCAD